MNDSRILRILAAYDDIRTEAADLLEQLPSTNSYVLALRRARRRANEEIRALQAAGSLEQLKADEVLR